MTSGRAAGAIIAIAFIHNLLRRHPSCSVLVHRPKTSLLPKTDTAAAAAPAQDSTHNFSKSSHQTATSLTNGVHVSLPVSQQATLASVKPGVMQNGLSGHAESDSDDGISATSAAAKEGVADGKPAAEAGNRQKDSIDAVPDAVDGEDVFDEQEVDPAKSRAIESSLWEVESLRQHSYHTVSIPAHSLKEWLSL